MTALGTSSQRYIGLSTSLDLDHRWHCGPNRVENSQAYTQAQAQGSAMDPWQPSLELVLYLMIEALTSAACKCHYGNPISRDSAKRNAVLAIGRYPLIRLPSWNRDQLWV